MKKTMMIGLCLLMCSGQALAVQTCKTSITATTPATDFIDHGDGTVTHTKTGLMWKQCSEGTSGAGCATGTLTAFTWQAALQHAEALNNGGGFATHVGWRLPNHKELAAIVEMQCITPAINATVFPATGSGFYVSSTPHTSAATSIRFFDFNDGNDSGASKINTYNVRLVRGGL